MLQFYADRVNRALNHFGGAATAQQIANYCTANGHRITARRVARVYMPLLATHYGCLHGRTYYIKAA